MEAENQEKHSGQGWFDAIWIILLVFALGGFFYNVSQHEVNDLFLPNLVDVIALCYSNLLAYPLLALTFWGSRGQREFVDREDHAFIWGAFLVAPFLVVGFQLLMRILERLW